jgi:hypothetical protein
MLPPMAEHTYHVLLALLLVWLVCFVVLSYCCIRDAMRKTDHRESHMDEHPVHALARRNSREHPPYVHSGTPDDCDYLELLQSGGPLPDIYRPPSPPLNRYHAAASTAPRTGVSPSRPILAWSAAHDWK